MTAMRAPVRRTPRRSSPARCAGAASTPRTPMAIGPAAMATQYGTGPDAGVRNRRSAEPGHGRHESVAGAAWTARSWRATRSTSYALMLDPSSASATSQAAEAGPPAPRRPGRGRCRRREPDRPLVGPVAARDIEPLQGRGRGEDRLGQRTCGVAPLLRQLRPVGRQHLATGLRARPGAAPARRRRSPRRRPLPASSAARLVPSGPRSPPRAPGAGRAGIQRSGSSATSRGIASASELAWVVSRPRTPSGSTT